MAVKGKNNTNAESEKYTFNLPDLIFTCTPDNTNRKIESQKKKNLLLSGVTYFNQFGTYGLKHLEIPNEENQAALKRLESP